MVTYEEALKLTIEGDAVFLVGSGFSTGAENNFFIFTSPLFSSILPIAILNKLKNVL